MKKTILSLYAFFLKTTSLFSHLLLFAMRLWMANIFWKSGVLKFNDWETTVQLFTDEHPVPFMPPEVAAFFGTTFELTCPILLTLGLASRLATLPMLAMTAVIEFTYMDNLQHFYWAFLLGTILCIGPGKISADQLIKNRFGSP